MRKFNPGNGLFFILLFFAPFCCKAQTASEIEVYNKGVENLNKSYFYQAIDDFNITVKSSNTEFSAFSYYLRGAAKNQSGKYSEAVTDYSSAIDLSKSNPDFYNSRAWTYCILGYYNIAVADATNAIKLSKKGAYYDTRATAYGLLRSTSNAILDFDEAIKLDKNALYYYKRGLVKKANLDFKGGDQDIEYAKLLDKTENYLKQKDPLIAVYTHQNNGNENIANNNQNNTKKQTLDLSANFAKVGKYSVYFPGKPSIETSSNSTFSFNYIAYYKKDNLFYYFQYAEINYKTYEETKDRNVLKELRENYFNGINAEIDNVSYFAHDKFKVVTQYKTKSATNFGWFFDAQIDNAVFRIGIFNSSRYPTFEEAYSFFKSIYFTQ